MIGTIVVGTDGSQTAKRAVATAADFARRFGARLHLVNGYNDPSGAPGLPSAARAAVREGAGPSEGPGSSSSVATRWRRASDAVLEDAAADPALSDLEVTTHSVPAAPAQALLEVARSIGADLIVVGNRGMRGEAGSIPDVVTRQAPCHVLIAKTT